MTVTQLTAVFGWSLLINYLLLMLWAGIFLFAHGWLFRLHCRWFDLGASEFDAIHYGGMALYKIGIFLFNLTPWLALLIVS